MVIGGHRWDSSFGVNKALGSSHFGHVIFLITSINYTYMRMIVQYITQGLLVRLYSLLCVKWTLC